MDRNARGLWLVPTHGRVTTNVPRFLKAAVATGMTTAGALIVDEDEYAENAKAYSALPLPANWKIHLVKGGCCASATEEALHDLLTPDMEWIGWTADDCVPVTDEWDGLILDELTPWNCVSTDDGKFAPRKFNGAHAWGADLVRAVGYLFPAGLKHFYIDDCWEELHRLTGIWRCRMDVLVEHRHASWYGNADATTAHTNSFWQFDDAAFIKWKERERMAAANRIGDLMVRHGVAKPLPDLSDVRVMIATPSGDGKYDRRFVESLFATIQGLSGCGASVNFAELPFCSDIALARSKLFGMFYRSDATHLLSIDSDMGWRAQDAIRLFTYKRDFVAVAGPRKVFPPSFATQYADANGRPIPLTQETETGLMEVSDVGMAFALLTRNWANRMVAAYSDLEYAGDDCRPEYALFNPMIVNRRYKSEDFAACHRWRSIGGHVYVDPSISLEHVGTFVWSGDLLNHLIQTIREQQIAA